MHKDSEQSEKASSSSELDSIRKGYDSIINSSIDRLNEEESFDGTALRKETEDDLPAVPSYFAQRWFVGLCIAAFLSLICYGVVGGTQRPLVTATEVAKDIQELSSEPSDPARVVSDIIEPTLSRTPQEAIARTTHMDFQRLIEQVTDTVDSDQVHQRGEGFYWEATP